jgi:hypothetical protein
VGWFWNVLIIGLYKFVPFKLSFQLPATDSQGIQGDTVIAGLEAHFALFEILSGYCS